MRSDRTERWPALSVIEGHPSASLNSNPLIFYRNIYLTAKRLYVRNINLISLE